MALVECPDCYNQISDRAKACPYCGAPMREDDPAPRRESREIVRYQDRAPARQRREVVEVVRYVDDDEDPYGDELDEYDAPALLPERRRGVQPQQYRQSVEKRRHNAPRAHPEAPQYHDNKATFIDPEEPFRNNTLWGAIKGQASFRATFLWWLVGFCVFGFLAFETGITLAIIPAAIWFWGELFLMFWNARNIYSKTLKYVVLAALVVGFAALIFA